MVRCPQIRDFSIGMMESYAQNINDKILTKTGYFQYEKRTISIKCYRQYTRDINTYHKNTEQKLIKCT